MGFVVLCVVVFCLFQLDFVSFLRKEDGHRAEGAVLYQPCHSCI